jgi:hypothetical protein
MENSDTHSCQTSLFDKLSKRFDFADQRRGDTPSDVMQFLALL